MRFQLLLRIGAAAAVVCAATSAVARAPTLLEFVHAGETYRGKLLAHDDETLWLLRRDGRLAQLAFDNISAHRQIAPRFDRLTAAEFRDQLRSEFTGPYEVVGTSHYLVCAPVGRAAAYSRLFEDVYRAFYTYFSTRGVGIRKPEFPLVAIVFRDQRSFIKYRRQDGLSGLPGLVGYYHVLTNRVAVFESSARAATVLPPGVEDAAGSGAFSGIQSDLRDTIVHEGTHQVAFNTGLHPRIGTNPRWVVEGLATVFEADGIRNNNYRQPARTRINRCRYVHFRNFSQQRREKSSLEGFIADGSAFQIAPLDAYSQSWALTFFLVETRPVEYARFLTLIAEREPMQEYTPEQRVEDFRKAFGGDVEWLEVEFLRFIERLR